MPRAPQVRLLLLAALLALATPGAAAAPGADFETTVLTFRREAASSDIDVRLRAYQRIGQVPDARAVPVILDAVEKERARRDLVRANQNQSESALEVVLSDIEKANAQTPRTPREIDAFNARVKKLEERRDASNEKLRDLALELAQEQAILGAASASISRVIQGLPGSDAPRALDVVAAAWMGPKALPEQRVAWVDVLAGVNPALTGPALRTAAMDDAADPRVRVAALGARVARRDAGVLEDCVALIGSTSWPVAAEAIDGLRRLHVIGGIEPLIAFLGRDDIGRLRTDAQRALCSLTGQKHGPFRQPWQDWWASAKPSFAMPAEPAAYGDILAAEKAGVTFYGITTFSDAILFVVDVSRSMLDVAYPDARGDRGKERKIDVARRELAGALAMLDERKKFNLLFFGHRVVRYEAGMIPATTAATERARRFSTESEPTGGTNIHDVLDTAFRMAHAATADNKNYRPVIDTIFFLTDGTPTAGKLQKPGDILGAVREWNRTAKITIHCIALGDDCDMKFLKQLAEESQGVFVKR